MALSFAKSITVVAIQSSCLSKQLVFGSPLEVVSLSRTSALTPRGPRSFGFLQYFSLIVFVLWLPSQVHSVAIKAAVTIFG